MLGPPQPASSPGWSFSDSASARGIVPQLSRHAQVGQAAAAAAAAADMAAKAKPFAANHTAGIFSDSTVDGPKIGTLVIVVDRAKNLPNRKTIGKQDPYCAARLGKEANKTTTDIRGGQTPKWDQELRFTVHDSPDYFQLKLSVFNDDKKTEMIGETWIDLREVIIPGGGQNDLWHQLSCKGKYAGEIRIESTFYDSRPKPVELPPEKSLQMQHDQAQRQPGLVTSEPAGLTGSQSTTGPRAMPKRRPLPTDPVTGRSPAGAPSPSPVAEPLQTPVRMQSNPALASGQPPLPVDYATSAPQPAPSPRYPQQSLDQYSAAAGTPNGPGTPTYRTDKMPQQQLPPPQQSRTHERADTFPSYIEERGFNPNHPSHHQEQQQQQQQPYDRHDPRDQRLHDQYEFSSVEDRVPAQEADRPPPPPVHRSRNNSGGGAGISPAFQPSGFDLVPVKGTPPSMRQDVLRHEAHRHSVSTAYPGKPTYRAPPAIHEAPAVPAQVRNQGYHSGDGQPAGPGHRSYEGAGGAYDPSYRAMQATVEDVPDSPSNPLRGNSNRSSTSRPPMQQIEPDYEINATSAPLSLHQSRSSPNVALEQQGRQLSGAYGTSPPALLTRDVRDARDWRDLEDPRDYSRDPNGAGYGSVPSHVSYAPHVQQALTYHNDVEDARGPDGYVPVPSPVPISLTPGRALNVASGVPDRFYQDRQQQSQPPLPPPQSVQRRYTQPLPLDISTPPRGHSGPQAYEHDSNHVSPVASFGAGGDGMVTPSRGQTAALSYQHSSMPTTPNNMVVSPTAGYYPDANYGASPGHSPSRSPGYSPGISPGPNRSPGPGHSPSPGAGGTHHTIRRKSVSPAPPPLSNDDHHRRLSGVPFGPDSYDELNPGAAAAAIVDPTTSRPDYDHASGMIIGSDGREIDPTDHLPMETWAPERDVNDKDKTINTNGAKGNHKDRTPNGSSSHIPPIPLSSSDQSPGQTARLASSGRRQLRIAGRPYSMAQYSQSVDTLAMARTQAPPAPAPVGRNKLQKKTPRAAAARQSLPPSVMSGANGLGTIVNRDSRNYSSSGGSSLPLAPLPPHQDHNYAPPPRAGAFDGRYYRPGSSGGENYSGVGGSSRGGGGFGAGAGGAPPIPAKVPLALPPPPGSMTMTSTTTPAVMSGALQRYGGDGGGGGGAGQLTLMEEMQRIDIGTGRSRRRGPGGYY